ncbi:MAG TPA: CoA pyrophosphatase [Acidimicrobiales bacterium]|nr:CoA pyrophosphatase [Acidimicrobiales bacterium]
MAEQLPIGPHIPRPEGAVPGSPAPWSVLPEAERRGVTIDEVARSLEHRVDVQPRARSLVEQVVTPAELPDSGDSRPAAVVCVLFEADGEANVLLTRRSAHLRSHGGEVSFPGGRLQPGELPLQAALREAQEEVGVDPATVEVIGQLTPLTTVRSPALVHCFVARLAVGPVGREWGFRSDPTEVEKVFWVPLAELASGDVYHEELWPIPGPVGWPSYRAVPFFRLAEDVVWGATGRLLTELLGTVLGERNVARGDR